MSGIDGYSVGSVIDGVVVCGLGDGVGGVSCMIDFKQMERLRDDFRKSKLDICCHGPERVGGSGPKTKLGNRLTLNGLLI